MVFKHFSVLTAQNQHFEVNYSLVFISVKNMKKHLSNLKPIKNDYPLIFDKRSRSRWSRGFKELRSSFISVTALKSWLQTKSGVLTCPVFELSTYDKQDHNNRFFLLPHA